MDKNQYAVKLGQLGGKKGGVARANNLSPERRKEIAQKAAQARWAKNNQPYFESEIMPTRCAFRIKKVSYSHIIMI